MQDHPSSLGPPKAAEVSRRVSIMSSKTSDSGDNGGGSMAKPMLRRRSTLRNIAHSMMAMRRKSMFVREAKPKPKLENTYKATPDEGHEFRPVVVRNAIQTILSNQLKDVKYSPKEIKALTSELSLLIQRKVKGLGFDRHKLICNVVIGQRTDQGVQMASRCLWDPVNDNWASVEFVNDTVFAIATVHGVYFD